MAIANSLAFLLYLCCGVILIRQFVQGNQTINGLIPISILTILALIFHAADIFFTMQSAGGWDLGLFTSLSVIAWLMALLAFIAGSKISKSPPGMVIYPLVALSLMLKTALPSEQTTLLISPALEWHILLSLAAYSLFTLAALQAIVLAIQEQQLHHRHVAGLIRQLPPLQTMETGLFQLVTTGFILLTLGLVAGLFFIEDMFAQHLIHKTVLSLIAWCVFATLLWGRWQYGWRGRSAIRWTLLGFTFLALAYLGTKFVLEFVLSHS